MDAQEEIEGPTRAGDAQVRTRKIAARRLALFALLVAASATAFLTPLRRLLALCEHSTEYNYIFLIPVMVLCLFFVERKKIFRELDNAWRAGSVIILAGFAMAGVGFLLPSLPGADGWLTLEIGGLVAIWVGGFVLCFGAEAARAGLFPLLFSLLFVPLPRAIMTEPLDLVRHGSADVASFFFALAGVPVFRDGLTFTLSRLRFFVAAECSGIHSTVALFIASVLAGHFYFRAAWKKAVLIPLIFPIVSLTNGLRMFIIAMLSNYVNIGYFYGNLHHKGGSIFFVLGLVILAVTVKLLGGSLRLGKQY